MSYFRIILESANAAYRTNVTTTAQSERARVVERKAKTKSTDANQFKNEANLHICNIRAGIDL